MVINTRPSSSGLLSRIARECKELAASSCMSAIRQLQVLASEGDKWAITQLLDRGIGKPSQSIELLQGNNDTENVIDMTTPALDMLFEGKVMNYLAHIYEQGKLIGIVSQFQAGWRPEGFVSVLNKSAEVKEKVKPLKLEDKRKVKK